MSDTLIKSRSTSLAPRRTALGGETLVAIVFFAILAVLPLFLGGYPIYILPQYLMFGLLALSLGLLWGFVGIVSFGQAAFFALGGYTMGLIMQSGLGAEAGILGLVAGALVGGLVAAVAGYFLFSAGVRAHYFVLITLALSIITEQIAVSQSQLTGGWNGMFVDRMSLGVGSAALSLYQDVPAYCFVLPLSAFVYFGTRALSLGRFGKVLVGIRENEDRMIALGYEVSFYKTAAFALSGAIAGLAGGVYATHSNFVSPSLAGVLFSTEVVVWVALGGRLSLLGALVGGVVVSALSNYLSSVTPEYWQLIVGLIFIAVIAFFKDGLAGLISGDFIQVGRRRSNG